MARIDSLTTARIMQLLADQRTAIESTAEDQHLLDLGIFAPISEPLNNEQHTADLGIFAPISEPGVATQHTADLGIFAPISSTFHATTAYKAGQLVLNAGWVYSANADFTSGATFVGSNWTIVGLPVPVEGSVGYGTGWRTPTVSGHPPTTLTRTGNEVTLRGGSVENSVVLSMSGFGQSSSGAVTIPAGFRPGIGMHVPAMIYAPGLLMAGAMNVDASGNCILQTTTAISSAAIGSVNFALSTARWIATS